MGWITVRIRSGIVKRIEEHKTYKSRNRMINDALEFLTVMDFWKYENPLEWLREKTKELCNEFREAEETERKSLPIIEDIEPEKGTEAVRVPLLTEKEEETDSAVGLRPDEPIWGDLEPKSESEPKTETQNNDDDWTIVF